MLGPGQSSEAIWTPFASMATATVRPLKAKLLVAWTRDQVVESYAIVGTSLVGGMDIVKGIGDNVLNNADLYSYFDETDRVMRIEYERHLIEPLGGSAIAMATIVLDNTDLRFTPNYDATIGTALKPNRPVKIFIGFDVGGQEKLIPIIQGLSQQPKEDKLNRTVTIQINDFVTFLDGLPQETSIYVDKRTDEIIADILARAGIGSSNYRLDEGLNSVAFAGFGVGDFAGQSIKSLAEAEEGIFYQNEEGNFIYENRLKNTLPPYTEVQWTIEPDDILEWQIQESTQIINHIIINGKPRSLKGEVEIWRDGQEEGLVPGYSLEITAKFNDPVSTISAPEQYLDYMALTGANGAGSDITSFVDVDVETFTTTARITVTNNHPTEVAHMYYLKLRGTPATVDYEIAEVYTDMDSVGTYNQKGTTITNDFIQSKDFAAYLAEAIVKRYKDPMSVLQLKIRGVPHLQLRDKVRVKDMDLNTYTNYRIVGIQGIFEPSTFVQILQLREITEAETL